MDTQSYNAHNWQSIFAANYRLLSNGLETQESIAAIAEEQFRQQGSNDPVDAARRAWGEPVRAYCA
jgi:hypothetical protein